MSLIKKIGNVAKMTAFGVGLYALSAFSGMTTDANASVNSQISNSNQTYIVHEVKSGDTLSRIVADFKSQGYDISVDKLAKINGIENPDYIEVGHELRIPGNDDDKIDYVPTKVSLDSTKDLKQSVKKDTSNQKLSEYRDNVNLEGRLGKDPYSPFQKIPSNKDIRPTSELNGPYNLIKNPQSPQDIEYNRQQVLTLTGDEVRDLRFSVGINGLEKMLDLKRGVSVHTDEERINALASTHSYLEQYTSGTNVNPETMRGILLLEGGSSWRISHSGALGAYGLVADIYSSPENMALHVLGPINPLDIEGSTRRACELYAHLLGKYKGDNNLALAAYTLGENKIDNLVKLAKEELGSKFTFAELLELGGKEFENVGEYVKNVKANMKIAKKLEPLVLAKIESDRKTAQINDNYYQAQLETQSQSNDRPSILNSQKNEDNLGFNPNSSVYGSINPRLLERLEKNNNFRNDLVARQEDLEYNLVLNSNQDRPEEQPKPKGRTYLAQNDGDIGCILANPPKYQGNPSQRVLVELARREEERRKKLFA